MCPEHFEIKKKKNLKTLSGTKKSPKGTVQTIL